MADFWNYTVIGKPVCCKLKVSTIDHADILHKARKTLDECVQYFIKKDPLDNESFILQRLIYMKNGQLRREKSFQGLKQILSAIRRLKDVDLQAILNDIHEDFKQAELESAILSYLPSRQMWEYLLTRILSVAVLVGSIISRCMTVFVHVKQHLSCGILIGLNLTFLALLSRIWARCRSLSEAYQKWYQDLYPVLFVLTPTNIRWLPEGQELPCDLVAWQKSRGFTPALQESSLEVLSDEWSVLLKKCESVHGDDIEEQMTDISEIDRLPDLHLAHMEEDIGESVSLNEAITTWSAGKSEPVINNKSEKKKKKMKETKKEKKKKRLSQKDLVIPWDADITHKIEEASSFVHLLTFLNQWRDQLCHKHDTRHDKCHSALISLRKKARKAKLKNNLTQHHVLLQNAKKKLSKFLKWTIKNKHLKNTKKPKTAKTKSASISESMYNIKRDASEMEQIKNISKSSTQNLLAKRQLQRVIKSVRRNHCFKLKGKVYQLSKEEAKSFLSDLSVFEAQDLSEAAHRDNLNKAKRALKKFVKQKEV